MPEVVVEGSITIEVKSGAKGWPASVFGGPKLSTISGSGSTPKSSAGQKKGPGTKGPGTKGPVSKDSVPKGPGKKGPSSKGSLPKGPVPVPPPRPGLTRIRARCTECGGNHLLVDSLRCCNLQSLRILRGKSSYALGLHPFAWNRPVKARARAGPTLNSDSSSSGSTMEAEVEVNFEPGDWSELPPVPEAEKEDPQPKAKRSKAVWRARLAQ